MLYMNKLNDKFMLFIKINYEKYLLYIDNFTYFCNL